MSNTLPSTTALIGKTHQRGGEKYIDVVSANNGKLYMIPFHASRVLSMDTKTNQWKYIGDDLDNNNGGKWSKWWSGVFCSENNKIICAPFNSDDVLIINTNSDVTETIRLPLELCNQNWKYKSCVSDEKGNVFFFPYRASKMMKINVFTKDISVLHDVDDCGGFLFGAIRASDGFIYSIMHTYTYGISEHNEVMKFNPNNYSFEKRRLPVDNIHDESTIDYVDLVEYKDGNLYALPFDGYRIVKINTNTFSVTNVGTHLGKQESKWSRSVVGKDNCIYGIPFNASHVVRFDPSTDTIATIGQEYDDEYKWYGGCLATDGNIYAAAYDATHTLKIAISRWNVVAKEHVMLRWLVENKRASLSSSTIDDVDVVVGCVACYYVYFIQRSDDDVFRMILQFL